MFDFLEEFLRVANLGIQLIYGILREAPLHHLSKVVRMRSPRLPLAGAQGVSGKQALEEGDTKASTCVYDTSIA